MIPLSEQLRHLAANCDGCGGTGRFRDHDGAEMECMRRHLTCSDLRQIAERVAKLERSQCANGESIALQTTCGRAAR